VPDMTNAEQRMAALIKLRLSGKDAARILGISPDSVRKSRQRLRQRLGLQGDEELEPFFTDEQANT
jgi:DNA-binding CsgD family transcriptional regulator